MAWTVSLSLYTVEMPPGSRDQVLTQLGRPVLGYIIFPIAAGVGGAEAKALHDQMDDIDRKIERDNFEIAQYKKLMFNIGLVAKKIDYLSQIIQPAIRVIQVFEGVWTAIVADLTAVQNALSKDSVNEEAGKKITALLLNLNVESIMKKWKKVGERGGSPISLLPVPVHLPADTDNEQPTLSDCLRTSRTASRTQK